MKNLYVVVAEIKGKQVFLNSMNGLLYLSAKEGDKFDKKTAERGVKFLAKQGYKAEAYQILD